jgi:hypothetical protein
VSPDGRWLVYFALKATASWAARDTYCAVSRLPWLTALAAWSTCGTWTRGFHFAELDRAWEIGEPDVGDVQTCRRRYGMKAVAPAQFPVERRRGWSETPDGPTRDPRDFWDARRNVRLFKPQPGGTLRLLVESVGTPGGEWEGEAIEGLRAAYWLESADDLSSLDDVQWADWDPRGRLLVATRSGKLQIQTLRGFVPEVTFEQDLAPLEPAPQAPPPWAQHW